MSTGTGDGSGGKVDAVTFLSQHATRPLVTLLLVVTFCWGFYADKIGGEGFSAVVAGVIGFWFGQRGQETRASDRISPDPGATATAPPSGGTATATVTTSPNPDKETTP